MLDLRLPTGIFFATTGIILVGLGVLFPSERAALTESNVNLYCGLVMLAFGAFMLVMAQRARRRKTAPSPSRLG
jgi:hypothetical protein